MFFHLCLSSNQIAGFIGHQYLQKDSHDFITIFFFLFGGSRRTPETNVFDRVLASH